MNFFTLLLHVPYCTLIGDSLDDILYSMWNLGEFQESEFECLVSDGCICHVIVLYKAYGFICMRHYDWLIAGTVYKPEVKESISRPLKTLLEKVKQKNRRKDNLNLSTSLLGGPSSTLIDDPLDDLLLDDVDSESPTDFTSTTLQYIIDAHGFLNHMGKHGLANVTVDSSFQGHTNKRHEQENHEPVDNGLQSADHMEDPADSNQSPSSSGHASPGFDPSQDLFAPSTPQKRKRPASPATDRKRHKSAVHAVRSAIIGGLKYGSQDTLDTDSRIAELSRNIELSRNKYIVYDPLDTKYHNSYEWLLRLCSTLVMSDPKSLQNLAHLLELNLFIPSDKQTYVQKKKLTRYAYMYKFQPSVAR